MTQPSRPARGAQATRGSTSPVARIIQLDRDELLAEWAASQSGTGRGLLDVPELRRQGGDFLALLGDALAAGGDSLDSRAFAPVRGFLDEFSRSRAQQGFSPSETVSFVLAMKAPLVARLRDPIADGEGDWDGIWSTMQLIDSLALYTTEVFQRGREEVILRQQQDMLELSTPVVMLWDGVLALPMIGTLDSARTQVVMEALLQRIVETGADIAIIDITGVPTVDTLTAQHLLKTVTAARLMGAECIISGIRPQIAQTIVHLGVDLGNVITKASLADAFRLALQRTGRMVTRVPAGQSWATPSTPGGAANGAVPALPVQRG
ncbi:MAG: STAS domain-containing protein [Gemmatimonadaceae bacterium]